MEARYNFGSYSVVMKHVTLSQLRGITVKSVHSKKHMSNEARLGNLRRLVISVSVVELWFPLIDSMDDFSP